MLAITGWGIGAPCPYEKSLSQHAIYDVDRELKCRRRAKPGRLHNLQAFRKASYVTVFDPFVRKSTKLVGSCDMKIVRMTDMYVRHRAPDM